VAPLVAVETRHRWPIAKRNAVKNSLHKTCNDLAVTLKGPPAGQDPNGVPFVAEVRPRYEAAGSRGIAGRYEAGHDRMSAQICGP
jgi:hypothetical protein